MYRNRYQNYRPQRIKYTFLFMKEGIKRVLHYKKYAIFTLVLLCVETLVFCYFFNRIQAMSLWIDMRRPYTFFLIAILVSIFAAVISEIGRPKDFRRIMREMEKIPRILNGDMEAPVLISRVTKGNNTEQWIFDTYGKHYSDFQDLKKEIESALDIGIIRITEGRDGHKVVIDLAVHPGPWPQMALWSDEYIVPDYNTLILGTNRNEIKYLDLSQTAHVLINGSTGSGKTVEMKSLSYCALMKGYQVFLVDYKGGVDYGLEWERHCSLVTDDESFLVVLDKLVLEQKQRFSFLRKHGCVNIDEYNDLYSTNPLQRIILFVDELGECLDKSGLTREQKENTDRIMKGLNTLCRLGRAAGISCIMSTQRGSADLLSGQIRNNSYKIVGMCDENLSLITIGTSEAAKELIYPGQFMDEHKAIFQGFFADYTLLLQQKRKERKIGCYGLQYKPISFLIERKSEVIQDEND